MKFALSLALCVVGYVQLSDAACSTPFGACNSKAFSLANGAPDHYGTSDGPCFIKDGFNDNKASCFFTYAGAHNYYYECNCGSDCDCPGGAPPPPSTCQTAYGDNCISKDQKNSNHWLMTGEGSCWLKDGVEKCYTSVDSTSYTNCGCDTHSSCKCGTTVVVTCDVPITTPSCTADTTKYCASTYDITTNSGVVKHTMCDYCGVSSANCKNLCKREMNSAQQTEIVNKHNELRSKVARGLETTGNQPKAADMNKLVWDDELAAIAQRFADQCTSGHDANRKIAAGSVGQNFYSSGMDNDAVENAATAWYSEVKDMDKDWVDDYSLVSTADFYKTGHYTQVVWAKTEKVGCGFIVFDDGSRHKYIICNYFPAGNFQNPGTKIYTKTDGAPGSGCSAIGKTQDTATGLCV